MSSLPRRIAALYDVHGNLPALTAVLAAVQRERVDLIVIGGDVLPGPMPRECLTSVLGLDTPTQFIVGNGEAEVLAMLEDRPMSRVPEPAAEAIRWSARQIDPEHRTALASWTETVTVDVDGVGPILFCHATPRNCREIFTRETSDDRLAPVFDGVDASLVVCGHTHMQFDRTVGDLRVVNAGSVGMPFGATGAHWLLLGPEVELRRTDYDLAAAAERIRATSYPQAADFAENSVLNPRSEAEMLAVYGKAELT